MATICNHHVLSSMHGLREKAIPQQQALERAGINPTVMDNKTQRVHTDQVARLFKTVQETLDDEFMGFTQNNCKVGLFATMAELVSHCSTLGELLEKAVNFYNLVSNDIPMHLSQADGNAVLSFTMNQPQLDPEHFMAEFWLVIWHRFPSWYIGEPIRLQETHFTFKSPAHSSELQIMFPGQLQFKRSANRLIFDAQYLDKPSGALRPGAGRLCAKRTCRCNDHSRIRQHIGSTDRENNWPAPSGQAGLCAYP